MFRVAPSHCAPPSHAQRGNGARREGVLLFIFCAHHVQLGFFFNFPETNNILTIFLWNVSQGIFANGIGIYWEGRFQLCYT